MPRPKAPPIPIPGDDFPAPLQTPRAPKAFTAVMSDDQLTIFVIFEATPSWTGALIQTDIQLFYIDATKVFSVDLADDFNLAKEFGSTLLTTFRATAAEYTVPLNINNYPDLFNHGGWLWAQSIGVGWEDFAPATSPVRIPTRNTITAIPDVNPALQVLNPAVEISAVTLAGNPYRKLLFSWLNPNPLDTLFYVLIFMFNYRNLGIYEEVVRFRANRELGGATSPSRVQRGFNGRLGPIYLKSDFDGAHNVTFYFVKENENRKHASTWLTIPSASAVAAGGI